MKNYNKRCYFDYSILWTKEHSHLTMKEVKEILNYDNKEDSFYLCKMGYIYYYGLGVEKNKKTAEDYFEKSAAKGFVPALHNLAEINYSKKSLYNETIKYNYAPTYYRLSVYEKENKDKYYLLSLKYGLFDGYINLKNEKNETKAAKILNKKKISCKYFSRDYYFEKNKQYKALKNEFKNALYFIKNGLGKEFIVMPFLKQTNAKKIIKYLLRQKDNYGLGYFYASLFYKELSESKYLEYIYKAIDKGNILAKLYLAMERIKNNKIDEEVFNYLNDYYNNKYYKEELSNVINELANCYLNGYGCKKDINKGIELLEENFYFNDKYEGLISYYYNLNGIGDYKKVNQLITYTRDISSWSYDELKKRYYSISKKLEENIKINKYVTLSKNGDYKALYELYKYFKEGKIVKKDLHKAFIYLKEAYDNGYYEVRDELANCYLNGIGVEKNEEIANELLALNNETKEQLYDRYLNAKTIEEQIKWVKMSANLGYAPAQNDLGYFYDKGEGVNKDLNEAIKYYKLSAEQGYAIAQYNLAICYLKGEGVEKNLKEAFKYFKLSADQGHSQAQRNVGNFYFYGDVVEKNLKEAFKYYKLSADQGDYSSQNTLAYCYTNEIGVEKNLNKAFIYFELSAKQGSPIAERNLAICYLNGYGVEKNLELAIEYFKLSAAQNHVESNFMLGKIFLSNEKKNYHLAEIYFEKAANEGHIPSMKYLIELSKNGKGEIKSSKAFNWALKAAQLGDVDCQALVGGNYYYGIGTKKNPSEGIKWLELAASKEDGYANYKLGNINLDLKKYDKAFYYYDKAIKYGNLDALNNFGTLYLNGYGCKKDYNMALKYFELAKSKGIVVALYNLGLMYYKGYGVKVDYLKAFTYFKESYDKEGRIKSAFYLGCMYYYGYGVEKNYNKALEYFEKGKKTNVSLCSCYIANMYYNGYGSFKQDYSKAKYEYEFVVLLKHVDSPEYSYSLSQLGVMYYYAYGVKKDLNKSLYYFKLIDNPSNDIIENIKIIKNEIANEEEAKKHIIKENNDDKEKWYDSDDDYSYDSDDYDEDYDEDYDDEDTSPHYNDNIVEVYNVDYYGNPITDEEPTRINTLSGYDEDGNRWEPDTYGDGWHTVDDE